VSTPGTVRLYAVIADYPGGEPDWTIIQSPDLSAVAGRTVIGAVDPRNGLIFTGPLDVLDRWAVALVAALLAHRFQTSGTAPEQPEQEAPNGQDGR